MRHHAPARTLAAALLAACAGCADDPTRITAGDAAAGQPVLAVVPVPISGSCEMTFDPPPLPPPPVFTQTDTGTCQLAHLGRAAFRSVKQIDVVTGTQTILDATFTAPNGDVLRATGSGTSAPVGPGRFAFTSTLTFAGGSGRFSAAACRAARRGRRR
jgi:hypothetical protein